MKNIAGRRFSLRSVIYIASAAAGSYALYFARLGGYPLLDPDEPIYGQVAKEMAGGAGWLTPHYGGNIWFDKPPLFYWLTAFCAKLFGPTELAYRLPSAIMAVALVLLVYAFASYEFGKKTGVLSALVMGTCLQQIILARAAVTDMTFVVCLTCALYAYRRWIDAYSKDRFGWALLCGVMTGLGMLTKGPVAPALLSITICIHLYWIKRLKRLRGLDTLLAVAAALAVGLPWYVLMYIQHGDMFVQGFLVANNLTRFLKAEHAAQTGHWYSHFINVPILFAFLFPWSVFLPAAIWRGWRLNQGMKLAAVWMGVVFLVFSLSKTILVTYIFPIYPAAAIFIGSFLHYAASKETDARGSIRRALSIALGISILLFIAVILTAHHKYPEATLAAIIMGGILVTLSAGALIWVRIRPWSVSASAWIMGAGMTAFALWLVSAVVPFVAPRGSMRELVADIPSSPRITIVGFGVSKADTLGNNTQLLSKPSLLYYIGHRFPTTDSDVDAKRYLLSKNPVFLICRQDAESVLSMPGCTTWAKAGDFEVIANAAGASLKGLK